MCMGRTDATSISHGTPAARIRDIRTADGRSPLFYEAPLIRHHQRHLPRANGSRRSMIRGSAPCRTSSDGRSSTFEGQLREPSSWTASPARAPSAIEALSAGGGRIVFIEHLPAALSVLRHNIAKLEAGEKTRVWPWSSIGAVILLPGELPPSTSSSWIRSYLPSRRAQSLKVIKKRDLLAPGGLIVLRHPISRPSSKQIFRPQAAHHAGGRSPSSFLRRSRQDA